MTNYDQLPDVQREVLRQVFRSPDYMASMDDIKAHCYYPDAEAEQAVGDLVSAWHLIPLGDTTGRYRPSAAMLEQMQAKRDQADAGLRSALNQAKPFGRDDD